MELFLIIVNGGEPLTIITNCPILDVAAVLDPPLVPQHASEGIFPLSIYLALRKKCPYSELFWSGFFPHSDAFPAFGRIENAGKIRTRITLNTDTFYTVFGIISNLEFYI